MKLVTFQRPGQAAEPGYLQGSQVISLAGEFGSVIDVLAGGAAALAKASAVTSPSYGVSSVKVLAPVPKPPKIICIGLNYRDHAIETNMAIPETPTVFCKFPTAVIGPGDTVVLPKISVKPDYEAEFAFVIGKGGRHIAAENWRDHVAGYMNLNDVSARDIQLATTQWVMGKTFDTFCPMGPYLATADEIADPHNLDIQLSIGGEVLQKSNTKNLIFDIPKLISHLSSVFTLETGDVVSTGTPSGVGMARGRWLKPGDTMVVQVQGLGELSNPCVAEA
ncbi:MAG: fumarylacetoacetate hydrolase family protein [Acidobacteria bacterium]|nr:fumarylacetoacetate hydrolase family protein [Acidobacteriota bacterium]